MTGGVEIKRVASTRVEGQLTHSLTRLRYRVKAGVCTPTNPADCTKQYSQMLDPRFGKSKEEQAAMDARNDKELGSLRSMMEAYEYKPSK